MSLQSHAHTPPEPARTDALSYHCMPLIMVYICICGAHVDWETYGAALIALSCHPMPLTV
eukprot:1160971-Pelagomonas_calceolata.AAC.8